MGIAQGHQEQCPHRKGTHQADGFVRDGSGMGRPRDWITAVPRTAARETQFTCSIPHTKERVGRLRCALGSLPAH